MVVARDRAGRGRGRGGGCRGTPSSVRPRRPPERARRRPRSGRIGSPRASPSTRQPSDDDTPLQATRCGPRRRDRGFRCSPRRRPARRRRARIRRSRSPQSSTGAPDGHRRPVRHRDGLGHLPEGHAGDRRTGSHASTPGRRDGPRGSTSTSPSAPARAAGASRACRCIGRPGRPDRLCPLPGAEGQGEDAVGQRPARRRWDRRSRASPGARAARRSSRAGSSVPPANSASSALVSRSITRQRHRLGRRRRATRGCRRRQPDRVLLLRGDRQDQDPERERRGSREHRDAHSTRTTPACPKGTPLRGGGFATSTPVNGVDGLGAGVREQARSMRRWRSAAVPGGAADQEHPRVELLLPGLTTRRR